MIFFVTVALTFLVSRIYISMSLQQESEKNTASFDTAAYMINRTVSESVSSVRQMLLDERVSSYARLRYKSDSDLIHARIDCREYLRSRIENDSGLYGVLFMRPDGSLFGALPYMNCFWDQAAMALISADVTSQIAKIPDNGITWLGPFSGKDIYGYENGKTPSSIIIAAWKSVSVSYGECYTLMLMDEGIFQDMFRLMKDDNSALHLFTADKKEFFRSGYKTSLSPGVLLSEKNNGRIIKSGEGGSVCVFAGELANPDWTLVREVSMDSYEKSIREIRRMVWLLSGAVFALALGCYLIWLKRFMRSFDTLKTGIIRLGNGEFVPMEDKPFSVEEFESMRQEMNKTGLSLAQYMETIRRMEREQLELELRNFQTILSPHMIFNSITAIKWMAVMMGADPVDDMLTELSEMLRPVLREWRIQWTIREELDHLKHYTRLLDLRYGNNFKLDCRIPETLYDLLLPRFTLQPLIENACQHGGRPKEALIVTVTAARAGNLITITVSDNGHSISREKAEEIREMIRSGKRGESIGLYNAYSRLVICKGEDSRLEIEAIGTGGTKVTLRWVED